jgi:phosphohistidine phosphatase
MTSRLLYLVRHAKSDWAYEGLSDIDRPLNERGYRDAPVMAARVAKLGHEPDRIVSSPAIRALTTALIFARQFEHEASSVALEPRLYEASPAAFIHLLGEQVDAVHKLMVVAHNPTLTDVANDLGGVAISNVPTAAVVCVRFEAGSWAEALRQPGKLEFFEYPKKLS